MAITRITKAGSGGVNKDIAPVELPAGNVAEFTWSDSHNMRFLDGYGTQFYGHGAVYESPNATPYFLLPLVVGTIPYWIYAGATTIHCVALTSTLGSDLVTNGDFATGDTTGWSDTSGGGSVSVVSEQLQCFSMGSGQAITTVVGETYVLSFEYTKATSALMMVKIGASLDADDVMNIWFINSTSTSIAFTATDTTTWITFIPYLYIGLFILDNVTVKLDPGIVHTDLSGTAYTGAPNAWTGGVLGGIPILNNGTDDPQQWDTDIATNFTDLSNWPAATTCKSMRVYKQFLIAMDVTVSGTNYPYMVKWSHPAVPGAVPTSWDHTDETVDAGQTDLAEGSGIIIDGLPLRDSFIIYREGSIWTMNYVGGPYVFTFKKMLGTSGIMNRNCVVEFDGYHFVLTDNDMIVHDGNTAVPILDKQVRRDVFREIDSDARSVCFVMKNPFFNEIWVCYPSVGNTSCNKAVVWNYRDKTVSFKVVPSVYHGVYGQVDEAITDPWDDDNNPWSTDTTRWNEGANVPGNIRTLFASADDELYLMDAGGEGTPTSSYVERTGLIFGAAERRNLIKGIRPRISGSEGATIKISVGGTDDDPYATPTYNSTVEYTIGEDIRADMLVDHRYLAIKFENDDSAYEWTLDSFDIEWEDGGIW